MKLVIDIPEEIIITCMQHNMPVDCEMFANKMVLDIANGTPLPKGHGRLIDADALEHIIGQFPIAWEYGQGVNDCWDALIEAPTIIEADKEAEE